MAGPSGPRNATDPGALTAIVRFVGDPLPVPAEVPVSTTVPACAHSIFTEDLLVDRETRGIGNVVLRLEGIARGKAPPERVTVINRSCRFEPHVAVAVKGTRIALENADVVLHHTRVDLAGSNFFRASLPAGDPAPPARPISGSGIMELTCEIHKWMRAYVYVHTNPYLAVTDPTGTLRIESIPPGRYPYVAWHESVGEKRGEVEIVAGQPTELVLELAAPQ